MTEITRSFLEDMLIKDLNEVVDKFEVPVKVKQRAVKAVLARIGKIKKPKKEE